jgi:hypothetical protein
MITVAGAGLQAQNTGSTQDRQSTITVTGCLQPAGGAGGQAVGTSGSNSGSSTQAGAADSKGPFMLVNARRGSAPGGGSGVTSVAPPGSGTTESAARAGSTPPSPALSGAIDKNGNPDRSDHMSFALRGDNPELPRHVGQEVEISGRVVSAGASGSSASSAAASSTSGGATTASGRDSASSTGVQAIEVQTIRMIASVCAAN